MGVCSSKSSPPSPSPQAPPEEVFPLEEGREPALRILCLHGNNSNSDITRVQLVGLALKRHARCEMLHGLWPGSAGTGLADFSDGPWYTWSQKSMKDTLKDTMQWDQDQ